MPQPIPVILINGFLGAGKTTFLNWLLAHHQDKKISLILNEFGDIKLESQFVKYHATDIAELANGCMCCVAKSDIPRVINYILDHSPETEYILVEASGLSDPDPIMESFRQLAMQERVFLELVVCVVDGLNFLTTHRQHGIIMTQVAEADIVVISKVAEAGTEQVERISAVIKTMLATKPVLPWTAALSPSLFLTPGTVHTPQSVHQAEEHHHTHEAIDSWWYHTDKALRFERLQEVLQALPAEIIRVKGVVRAVFADGAEEKILVQYVGSRLEFSDSSWTTTEQPQTALLFLGTHIPEEKISQALDACQAEFVSSK